MAELEESQPAGVTWYTREGDEGETRFGRHGVVPKTDLRVAAYCTCDEANSGVSVAMSVGGLPLHVTTTLASVQNDLFDLVTDLTVPLDDPEPSPARIHPSHIERLERAIDHYGAEATDLGGLVLPGGTIGASLLYQARCIVRRAEISVWAVIEAYPGLVNPLTATYLNRLSTLLFVLAREANEEHGDVMWVPEASARAMAQEESGSGPDEVSDGAIA
ncbi:cob(I)yrinic acid a,c-diamide adenosyltransferase [Cryobacterium tepidiphilum]|uniref:Corrinoid adenosyltransferase n=1 Tax=Cryobacterium tepidiphilum TaxID=2486026 RepID=A0A3M8LFA7_9MICO|nr:cob(I)yrinic acid a,c-diamide adenosyltransferase [Cryobacterium tepidiphilum]RNE64161.1 cob(I)yrinic acid a,c-diamide adenosyltransferase [Cryobacterium tepidiphilum]